MREFNFVLRMADNEVSEGGFAKMKKEFEQVPPTTEGNLEESVVPENVVPENVVRYNEILSQNNQQVPVQNANEEMPDQNEFDKMAKGVMGDVEMRDVDDQNIEEILSSEQRNEMIAEILGDPEFEKLIDQTMEKAENDQLYVNMDKLTKDLIDELKNYEGNEKEAFKKIIKEFFEGASDKVEKAELVEKLANVELPSEITPREIDILNEFKRSLEGRSDGELVDINQIPKEVSDILGYQEIDRNPSLNPEKEPIIQAIRNINGQVFGKGEESEFDDIARRRANMLLKLYDSIESERIREEKIQKHREAMDEVFKLFVDERKDISKMALNELKDYILKETRRELLHEKVLEERKTKGEISTETNQELEKEYKDDPNGQKKIEFLRNASIGDLSELIAQEKSEISRGRAEIEEKERQNEVTNDERGSFLKDQGQKIISVMEEIEKDPKVAALEKIDIARSDGIEISKELLEEAYKAFDVKNHPERKKMIDEFAETGDISEQSGQSASVSVGKATKVVANVENPYKNGTPENNVFEIGKRDLLDAAQYNKHLIGISEKIEKGQKIEDIKLTGVEVKSPQQTIPQAEKGGSGQGRNFKK